MNRLIAKNKALFTGNFIIKQEFLGEAAYIKIIKMN